MAITCPPASQSFIELAKTPADVLDYEAQYRKFLGEVDVIIESMWTVSGPDESLEAFDGSIPDDQTTVIWLRNGTLGERYIVANRITTDQGRVLARSFKIRIVEHK